MSDCGTDAFINGKIGPNYPVIYTSDAYARSLTLGGGTGDQGELTLNSGSLTVNQNIMVGIDGVGKFYQPGGSLRTAGSFPVECLILGAGTGGKGSYELSGGTIKVGGMSTGFAVQGRFTMTGGSLTLNTGEIGALSGSTGTRVQSGGTVT